MLLNLIVSNRAINIKILVSMACAVLFTSNITLAEQMPNTKNDRQLVDKALTKVNGSLKNIRVEVIEWPAGALSKLGHIKPIAFVAKNKKTSSKNLPLLISLHGGGGKNWSVAEQLLRSAKVKGLALAEKSNQDLILFEPNSSSSWEPATLDYALSLLLERYPEVDTSRIYLIGHSMGGTGTLSWALRSPGLFAAVSPSGFRLGKPIDSLDNLVNLPMWFAVGSEDGERPADVMSVYTELKKMGNKQVGYTAFPGANHAQANAAVFQSADIVNWFLSHSKR